MPDIQETQAGHLTGAVEIMVAAPAGGGDRALDRAVPATRGMRTERGFKPTLDDLFHEIRDRLADFAHSPEVADIRSHVVQAQGLAASLPQPGPRKW